LTALQHDVAEACSATWAIVYVVAVAAWLVVVVVVVAGLVDVVVVVAAALLVDVVDAGAVVPEQPASNTPLTVTAAMPAA